MGFFVRKRIKVAPGVKVNLGLKQAFVTLGGRGVVRYDQGTTLLLDNQFRENRAKRCT